MSRHAGRARLRWLLPFVFSVLAAAAAAEPTVILLSLDGVRFDYPDRDALPAFTRMAREGARADALVPVFPSSTFPAHVSLATGAPADVHGIVGNRFLDTERGLFDYSNDASFLRAEPVWAAAERQGVRSASFFWVGSETAWNGVAATHRRAPFDTEISEAEKVDQILTWLDLDGAERPRLILSWWHGADRPGHRYGPDASETRAQLRAQDAELGRLLAGLDARDAWTDTTLLVVSDHGMMEVQGYRNAQAPLDAAGIEARVIQSGPVAHVHLASATDRGRAADALREALPSAQVHPSDAVPETLRYRVPDRTGDLVVLLEPPLAFSARAGGALWDRFVARFFASAGMHGYDPGPHREMDGILFALGRGARPGTFLGRVHALDVAPTVTALLGIDPPQQCEGRPIAGLRAPAVPVEAPAP